MRQIKTIALLLPFCLTVGLTGCETTDQYFRDGTVTDHRYDNKAVYGQYGKPGSQTAPAGTPAADVKPSKVAASRTEAAAESATVVPAPAVSQSTGPAVPVEAPAITMEPTAQ